VFESGDDFIFTDGIDDETCVFHHARKINNKIRGVANNHLAQFVAPFVT